MSKAASSRPSTGRLRDLKPNGKTKVAGLVLTALGLGLAMGWVPKCTDFQTVDAAKRDHKDLRNERALIEQKVDGMADDIGEIKAGIKSIQDSLQGAVERPRRRR